MQSDPDLPGKSFPPSIPDLAEHAERFVLVTHLNVRCNVTCQSVHILLAKHPRFPISCQRNLCCVLLPQHSPTHFIAVARSGAGIMKVQHFSNATILRIVLADGNVGVENPYKIRRAEQSVSDTVTPGSFDMTVPLLDKEGSRLTFDKTGLVEGFVLIIECWAALHNQGPRFRPGWVID